MKISHFLASIALFLPGTALAQDTWTVPGDFSTISAAVGAAAAGDTIEVSSGTYSQEQALVIDKALTIRGLDPSITAITLEDSDRDGLSDALEISLNTDPNKKDSDGGGANDGAEVAAGTDPNVDTDDGLDTKVVSSLIEVTGDGALVLEDISLFTDLNNSNNNCSNSNTGSSRGITAESGASLTLDNVWAFNLYHQDEGAAIRAESATTVISNSFFECNYTARDAPDKGGAIYQVGGNVDISASTFEFNGSRNGGAIFLFAVDTFTLHETGFNANDASNHGAAIDMSVTTFDAYQNLFCSNDANDGGAIYASGVETQDYANNIFAENDADDFGAAVYIDGGTNSPYFVNNTFAGNNANNIGGGGAMLVDGLLPILYNNLISRNPSNGVTAINFNLNLTPDFEYNLLYGNGSDVEDELGGDLAQYVLSNTNIHDDPLLTFWGNDGNCFVDAFYTSPFGPAVNAGDPSIVDVGGSRSDIGAYGGPGADVEDSDGDDWEDVYDCNGSDATIFPGATELCDEIDNNCDGVIDDGFNKNWYADTDEDGFGDESDVVTSCTPVSGYVANADDCDDQDDTLTLPTFWYLDQDGDGLGNPNEEEEACLPPSEDYVANDTDCDDTNANIGVAVDFWADADEDGFGDTNTVQTACTAPSGYVDNEDDCDDTAATTYPGADELCDQVDNDCDAQVDEEAVDENTYYLDSDNDTFGDDATSVIACTAPEDYVSQAGDCDDANAAINPFGDELCDDIDNDCTGVADDSPLDPTDWYLDADGDTYGAGDPVTQCDAPTDGDYVTDNTDCNDASPTSFPGAEESCDGLDNDCNGEVDDDAVDVERWYVDNDGDGVGTGVATQACEAPDNNYVAVNGDCDDEDPEVGADACENQCGCSATSLPGPVPGSVLLLTALLGLRQRRRNP